MCVVNGKYYLYGTGIGIPIWTSPDRTAFTSAGSIFPSGAPSETDVYTGTSGTASSLWAPDCTYYESTFYIYYAASQFGSETSGIFLVSSTNGLTGWLDHGLVTSSTTSSGYNAIDPTGGYYYLFTSFDICCDGTASTYNIRVTRSTSLKGPYVDESGVAALSGGGTEILGTHDYVYGPGGQSLLLDGDEVVLVYHYYSATTSILGINLLNFSTGWPVVY
ncbi:hypothetical protein HWV62_36434 [Athelia sp. TMB]|nr:hypothetical protein HWV62_36434 [Athelia sp. TMB]